MSGLPKEFVALDLETTGFDPGSAEIIEVGACIFDHNGIVSSFDMLVKPSGLIPPQVSSITGIVDEDVGEAPIFDEIRDELRDFIGDRPIVGHNVHFDVRFLAGNGIDLSDHAIYDTWQLATLFLRDVPSHSLEALSRLFGITQDAAHRAYDDAVASMHLFLKLISLFYDVPEKNLKEICGFLSGKEYVYSSYFFDALDVASGKKRKSRSQKSLFSISQKFSKIDHTVTTQLSSSEERVVETVLKEAESGQKIIASYSGYDDQIALFSQLLLSGAQRDHIVVVPDISAVKQYKAYFSEWGVSASYSYGLDSLFDEQKFNAFINKPQMDFAEIQVACKVMLWRGQTDSIFLNEVAFTFEEYHFRDQISCSYAGKDDFFSDSPITVISLSDFVLLVDELFDFSSYDLFISDAHDFERSLISRSSTYISLPLFSDLFSELASFFDADEIVNKISYFDSKIALFFGIVGVEVQKNSRFEWGALKIEGSPLAIFDSSIASTFGALREEISEFFIFLETKNELIGHDILERLRALFDDLFTFFDENTSLFKKISVHDERVTFYYVDYIQENAILSFLRDFTSRIVFLGLHVSAYDFAELRRLFGDAFSYLDTSDYQKNSIENDIVVYKGFPSEKSYSYLSDFYSLVLDAYRDSEKGLVVVMKSRGSVKKFFEKYGYEVKKEHVDAFFWGAAGSTGKVLTLIASSKKPLLIISAYEVFNFDFTRYRFDTMFFERLPFLPPKEYDRNFDNDFIGTALPRATTFFRRVFDHTHSAMAHGRKVYILDQRAVTARYAQDFFAAIDYASFEVQDYKKSVDKQ